MVYEQLYFGKKSWVFLTWNELKKRKSWSYMCLRGSVYVQNRESTILLNVLKTEDKNCVGCLKEVKAAKQKHLLIVGLCESKVLEPVFECTHNK